MIEATLALMRARGARSVTMEAIAEQAGITKITLYRNWKNRATIMAAALLSDIQKTLPFDEGAGPLRAIEGHLVKFLQALEGETGTLLREIISEFIADRKMMEHFREQYMGHRRETAVRLITQGLRTGEFLATSSPVDLHDQLYGAIFYRFLFDFGPLTKPAMTRLVDSVLVPRRRGADGRSTSRTRP